MNERASSAVAEPGLQDLPGQTFDDGLARGRSEIAQRIRQRAELSLQVVERYAHALFERYLSPVEVGEAIEAADALAQLFGRLELPNIARLARQMAATFADEEAQGPAVGARLASTSEDLRTLVDSAIAQQDTIATEADLVLVLGEPSIEIDAVCWMALTRGYAVVHTEDRLPPLDRAPAAVVALCPSEFTPAVGTALRAVTEQWHAPLLVVHDGADQATLRRLSVFGTTILPSGSPPAVVVAELTRLVAADRLQPRAVLVGEAPYVLRQFAGHGFVVTEVPHPDQLAEVLGGEPGLVVFGPKVEPRTVATTVHLLRATPALRLCPILWVGGSEAHALWAARLDVTIARQIDDALARRVAGQLRRLAADFMDATETAGTILSWPAARVLIDRALVAAHRSGNHVALASVRLGADVPESRLVALEEALGTEFRRNDILGKRDDRTLVVVLDGVPRRVATNRMSSLLTRLGFEAGTARVGVALFPSDGRSAVELVGAADQAIATANETDGPMVSSAAWRPVNDDTVDAMVVDADPVLGRLLVDLLVDSGLRAAFYESGPEALEALDPASGLTGAMLLLLDLDVPGIDGIGMLRRLRGMGVLSQVKVLLMTARSSEADLKVALDIGVADIIRKPFSATLLRHRVRMVLGDSS